MTGAKEPENDLKRALERGREAVVAHISEMEDIGQDWKEEAVTETLWRAAAPTVRPIGFTRHQERKIGADWAWWWIDETGECFGLLLQAKRFHGVGGNLTLDIGANGGSQNAALLAAADVLELPAGYVFYAGALAQRQSLTCGALHNRIDKCCERCSVTVMSALEAAFWVHSPRDAATAAINDSVPMEALGANLWPDAPIIDLNWNQFPPEFRELLKEPQSGSRAVAKEFFRKIAEGRAGQFSAAIGERAMTGTRDAVFPYLPDDAGHFSRPYIQHVFRGLRQSPPAYVLAALHGEEQAEEIRQLLGGVVILPIQDGGEQRGTIGLAGQ